MFSAEHLAVYTDDVADVPFFELLIGLFANHVELDVDLDFAACIRDVKEGSFAHRTFAHDSTCNRYRFFLQLVELLCNLLCINGAVKTGLCKRVIACLLQCSQLFAADTQHLGQLFGCWFGVCLCVLVFQVFCHVFSVLSVI